MKNKIIFAAVLCLFLAGLGLICRSQEMTSPEMRELMNDASSIDSEIDAIIREIKSADTEAPAPKKKEEKADAESKVVTPDDISETMIPESLRDKKISLEFEQANLESVVRTIGETAGLNIVLDPALKENIVDLHLHEVPIGEALNLLYNAYDLGSYQVGRSLFMTTRDKIKEQTLITKIIKLRNVSVEEAEKLIKGLVEIANKSEETNTFVVVGNPDDIRKVEKIIRTIDKPQPQVILEAKIIEISKDYEKNLGIDWESPITAGFQETKRKLEMDDPAESLSRSAFHVFRLTRNALAFDATINLLVSESKAKILSNPKVTTINNKTAEIFVGDEIPYPVTEVSGGVASVEVRYVYPGIRLKITPSIIEEDFVLIKIEPEVSTKTGEVDAGTQGTYPIITSRKATAFVRVKNGQPFIMGGLLDQQETTTETKVPFLGDIPLLGKLFKNTHEQPSETELLISVTPTIVSGEM